MTQNYLCCSAAEWLEFYKKSFKDAVLEDVLQMLNQMKEQIAKEKAK